MIGLLSALLLMFAPPGASGGETVCPGGRFAVDGRALLGRLPAGADSIVLGAADHVSIASGCEATPGRVARGRRGARIEVTWPRCGDHERIRLRARLGGPECRRLRGVIRVRGAPARRLRARRAGCGPEVPLMRCARFLNIAHRGGAAVRPENTLIAFAHAVELGADVLEMDVHGTADGQVVLMHDATVDRTTDGTGPVSGFTLAGLRGLDAGWRFTPDGGASFPYRGQGVRVPALADVLAAFPQTPVSIEIKQYLPSIVDAVLDELRRAGATSRAVLVSFDDATMAEVRAKAPPELLTGMSLPETVAFTRLAPEQEATYVPPAPVVQIPDFLVTPAVMARAERAGLTMQVWTVDDRSGMEALLALGVHGVMSNDPGLLAAVIREAGVAPGR